MDSTEIPVVGAVILRDGVVLCARRAEGGPQGGLWEFPGGKVEPDESPTEALVREIREELGCEIAVGQEVTTTVHRYEVATIVLTTYWCDLVTGEPEPVEHAEVRWLRPEALGELKWAPADLPAVAAIRSR